MTESKPEIQLYTVAEAAKILRVSERTVRNWIAEGRIKATQLGPRLIRISRADLQRFIGDR